MEAIHRSWDWLNSEPSSVVILAAAVVALALLTAFAAAFRFARAPVGKRQGPVFTRARHDASYSVAGPETVQPRNPLSRRPVRRRHRVKRRFSLIGRRIRRNPTIRENLLFLSRWASAPRQIGAVAPSSRRLGRAMAAELPEDYEICVELGGGTGSLTRALLAAGMPREKLIVIERDPRLAAHLRKRFRGVRVIQGEAQNLRALLRAEGISAVDAIVSGLPLRSLPRRVGSDIATESFAALKEAGVFIQFTYWLLPPVPRAIAAELTTGGTVRGRIWRNLPPAAVWRYDRVGR